MTITMELTKETAKQLLGAERPPSEWIQITQAQLDEFAHCTFDNQFIHVDPDAAKNTPFKTTIAHGFLLLALQTYLSGQGTPHISNVEFALNYGLNKVRFISPVPVNSMVRTIARITQITEREPGAFLITTEAKLEVRGQEKLAMVAEMLGLIVTR